jgi:Galactose oxidase, central domain
MEIAMRSLLRVPFRAACFAIRLLLLPTVLALAGSPDRADAQVTSATAPSAVPAAHLMQQLSDAQWRNAGDGLSIAVLEGDPGAPGAAYSLLLRMRDGAWIPPHWHPLDKRVVVLGGTLLMGTGDSVDAARATVLPTGGFSLVPARTHHYEGARGETTLLLYGTGPLTTNRVQSPEAQPSIPPARAHHAMIYDPDDGRVLLVGGSTPVDGGKRFQFFGDLWAFDGAAWRQLPSSDSQRSGVALARDSRRRRILSFGGYSGAAPFDDVRELEGGLWRSVGWILADAAAEVGFIFDERRNRFIAFGGSGSSGHAFGDTWAFDSTGWSRLPVAGPAPAARQGHVTVYDINRGRTIVFGGMAAGTGGRERPPLLNDVWEFDGARWVERRALAPSRRSGSGAAYDSKRGITIVFGGDGEDGVLGDTWSYDGTTWRKLSDAGPEPRAMGYLAYDVKRDRVVLFGGRKSYPNGDLNDTWEWDGVAWKRVAQ